ncbi:MAG TPA: glycosyl hydrolase family 5 [Bacteroidales bacterium]|nr:glycosyl hydrolase family 5 [Bacteroidales bacterium]
MKHFLKLLIAFFVVCILISCQTRRKESYSFPYTKFEIVRGTNIAHWLSQSQRRGQERENFFLEKDVMFIDSCGFDHIRLPIDEEQMWDESGRRNEDAFILLNNCLDWCQKTGLRVIIDLYILRSHHFNEDVKPLWTDPAEQDQFIALWKDLSDFIHERPLGMVAYEPMNEPVADDPEEWNILLSRTVDSIRKWEPERIIVVGSNRWQSATTFDELKVPENDPNIILSYHFYEPFFLTHYKASWTNLKDFDGEVNYPGQIVLNSKLPEHLRVYNRDTLVKMMEKPLRVASRLNLPLYCGEFGIYRDFFPAAKLAWYKDMISIFEEYGVAYANWNYKSGAFGIVDNQGKPLQPYLNIVAGKEK